MVLPFAFTIGLTVSITITFNVTLWLLVLASVAVKVMVFKPKLVPLKLVLLNDKLVIPQLSVEPLLT